MKRALLFILLIAVIFSAVSCLESDFGTGLRIYFIDTGQSDCTLIITPDNNSILIDTGDLDSYDVIDGFLSKKRIKKIDSIVLSHPHADHIGTADKILNDYAVDNIYMTNAITETAVFERLLSALENDETLSIQEARAGVSFEYGDVRFEFLSPISESYETLNEWSAVLSVSYGSNSFIFMGDAEQTNELEMLRNGFLKQYDLIKIGHHGSSNASNSSFIATVSPKYAVITCGADNQYGHPHKETLSTLDYYKVQVYRTDIDGTVSVTCDGESINIRTEK